MQDDRRRRGNGPSPLVMSLLLQIFSQLQRSPYRPPVTIALLAANILVHIHPSPYFLVYSLSDVRQNCIHPRAIASALSHGSLPLNRLVFAGFMHADDVHLYYNMLSLCWKGLQLETAMGSAEFLRLVCFSLLASHSLLVLMAYMLSASAGDAVSGFNTCAIGFSAVLFSMKYVLNQRSPALTPVMGFMVPAKYAAWCELVLISLITPNASFLGHLAGILAGWLYVHIPALLPAIPSAARYTYSSGTASSSNTSSSWQQPIELEELEEVDSAYGPAAGQRTAEEVRAHRLNRYRNRDRDPAAGRSVNI